MRIPNPDPDIVARPPDPPHPPVLAAHPVGVEPPDRFPGPAITRRRHRDRLTQSGFRQRGNGHPDADLQDRSRTVLPRVPADDHGRRKSDDDLRQAIALFRYGVIADPVRLPVGPPGTGATMRAKAEQSYAIPGSNRTRVAAATMRGWIADYRRGGFEALSPKPRTDRGKPRRLPAEIAERPIALKTGNPGWSVRIVIEAARREGVDHPLAPSSARRRPGSRTPPPCSSGSGPLVCCFRPAKNGTVDEFRVGRRRRGR